MTEETIQVVCIVYHPGPELDRFAETLTQATSRVVDLVVVDNGTDHTVAQDVCDRHAGRLVVAGANLGYGRAANLGAAQASTSWLVVANPDVEWSPGSLDALVAAAQADTSVGCVGPLIRDTAGDVYPSARQLPSLRAGAGHAVLSRVWPSNPWTRAYQAALEPSTTTRPAGWLSGSCLVLRRDAFDEVGGFDESYFMFFEDVDLGDRLGRAGWTNLYVPSAEVLHVGGTSWRSAPAAMIKAHHASARQYMHRRYPAWYQAPIRWGITVGLAVRQAVETRHGADRSASS
jgi:N-acetylglucosaminyl-diphospho-decaprenol L-rhamnosyltransferase